MSVPQPHFLLYPATERRNDQDGWKFVLKAADGSATLEANDQEPEMRGERLELLAVVRGLEALEQPSRVTLVTTSKYVNRGLSRGLEEWRRNDWTWESFGEMVPIKNRDLWQRLDRAMGYHRLAVRYMRIDRPAEPTRPAESVRAGKLDGPPAETAASEPKRSPKLRGPHFAVRPPGDRPQGIPRPKVNVDRLSPPPALVQHPPTPRSGLGRWLTEKTERAWLSLARCGTGLLPRPWLG
jgi:ribonuclease HI